MSRHPVRLAPLPTWRVLFLCIAIAVGMAPAGLARRIPSPGHKVTLALPLDTIAAARAAHLYAPLVERVQGRSAASILAHPPLGGSTEWTSVVLSEVRGEDDGKTWVLAPRAQVDLVAAAVQRCFVPKTGRIENEWPSRVLRAAKVETEVVREGGSVVIRFDQTVGPLLELLAGCPLRDDSGAPTGAYFPTAPGILTSRAGAPLGPTPLGVVEFTPPGSPADLTTGQAAAGGVGTLLAPFPDVILLLQSEVERARDPFGFNDGAGASVAFREELGAGFLLTVYWNGRGAAVEGILPPGLAPARPLPLQSRSVVAPPLTLATLGQDAPRVLLRYSFDDQLLVGVGDRLAVLLRSRGFLTDQRPARGGPLVSGLELLHWRPPTQDPALALLELAGRKVELQTDEAGEGTLNPRLLSRVEEERLEAALELERRWIEEHRVTPLMTAERWYTVDPKLREVHIRADGVPLLHDAFWGQTP